MPRPRAGLVAGDVEQLGAVLELADVGHLHEARAGVVGFVADDAIEFGGVRDDLVNREHRVRRRQDQILAGRCEPSGLAVHISTASVATFSA